MYTAEMTVVESIWELHIHCTVLFIATEYLSFVFLGSQQLFPDSYFPSIAIKVIEKHAHTNLIANSSSMSHVSRVIT